ncbi:MAG TPA: ATP-binding protein [Steroidobacteraceae bacterium]|jgi:C4-dicarboxylate-specific signal transduction histidine kinase
MKRRLSSPAILIIAVILIATAIFTIDLLTRPAFAALYLTVVLLALRIFDRRGVLLVSSGCIALTLLTYLISPDFGAENVFINCVISVVAIAITTHLGLKNKSSQTALYEVQLELAHINRITTLGELTASIAHEVSQPIGAVVTSAGAALRWLAAQPPNLEEGCEALRNIVKDAHRAGAVISQFRGLVKKAPPSKNALEINDTILEVAALTRGERLKNSVTLQTQLSTDLLLILGDRIQLQQVLLNLIINAIEAMGEVGENRRSLVVGSSKYDMHNALITVRDSGPGLNMESSDQLFKPFFTTKPNGLGMGLSICRSIIEEHGGRLWAAANLPEGAAFRFTLPLYHEDAS